MRTMFCAALFGIGGLIMIPLTTTPVAARGCIKGAIVGGLVGHAVGHGGAGAAAGCVIGHHHDSELDRRDRDRYDRNDRYR